MADTPDDAPVAEPKCPSCGVTGLASIVSHESDETAKNGEPWFYVAACAECGHVYGVFAKLVHTFNMTPRLR